LNLNIKILLEYLLFCSIGALVLSRLLFVLALIPSGKIKSIVDLIDQILSGGLVFYGGLFGVMIGIIVVCRLNKRDCFQTINIMTPTFPLISYFWAFGLLIRRLLLWYRIGLGRGYAQ